jgi:hypothetical protein
VDFLCESFDRFYRESGLFHDYVVHVMQDVYNVVDYFTFPQFLGVLSGSMLVKRSIDIFVPQEEIFLSFKIDA